MSKRHQGIKHINRWVENEYAHGRTTSISTEELETLARHYLPSLFESDFDKVKAEAARIARKLAERITAEARIHSLNADERDAFLEEIIKKEGSIQLLALTNPEGYRISQIYAQHGEKALFRNLLNKNFHKHEWFEEVLRTGKPYYSDLFFSKYTARLIMTAAIPLKKENGDIRAVLDIDFRFDELVKLITDLPDEIVNEPLEGGTPAPEASRS